MSDQNTNTYPAYMPAPPQSVQHALPVLQSPLSGPMLISLQTLRVTSPAPAPNNIPFSLYRPNCLPTTIDPTKPPSTCRIAPPSPKLLPKTGRGHDCPSCSWSFKYKKEVRRHLTKAHKLSPAAIDLLFINGTDKEKALKAAGIRRKEENEKLKLVRDLEKERVSENVSEARERNNRLELVRRLEGKGMYFMCRLKGCRETSRSEVGRKGHEGKCRFRM